MYTFSNKLRTTAITLMILGLVGIIYGFLTTPKTIEDVEKIVTESHHGSAKTETNHSTDHTLDKNEKTLNTADHKLDSVSEAVHHALEITEDSTLNEKSNLNVAAIQKGTKYPNRYIIMTGDIDSRNSDTMDFETDAPGANDNASGMAGTIEAARVLSKYKFENSS